MRVFDRVISLSLRGPDITDATLSRLSDLRHLTSITMHETQVTDQWIRNFLATNPDCHVVCDGVPLTDPPQTETVWSF